MNYAFNGQHTIEIVATVSGSRDTPVWCMIYDEPDYTQETDTFANHQKFVKPLVPYEIFMANLEAGNDEQFMIESLVESYSLQVGYSCSPASSARCQHLNSYRNSTVFMCWTGLSDFASAHGRAK